MSNETTPQVPDEVREAGLGYLRKMAGHEATGQAEEAPEQTVAEQLGQVAAGHTEYVMQDNVIVPKQQVEAMREAGQDVTVHSSAGRQS